MAGALLPSRRAAMSRGHARGLAFRRAMLRAAACGASAAERELAAAVHFAARGATRASRPIPAPATRARRKQKIMPFRRAICRRWLAAGAARYSCARARRHAITARFSMGGQYGRAAASEASTPPPTPLVLSPARIASIAHSSRDKHDAAFAICR